MIHTKRTITVGKQESVMNYPVILYRGDREVEVEFELVGSGFTFSNDDDTFEYSDAAYCQLVLNTHSDEIVFSEVVECNDGKVVFVVTRELIDELDEVGVYGFQIRLYDEDMTARVTIPPVYYGFDIREPLSSEDSGAYVDQAMVGFSRVHARQSDDENDIFDEEDMYNKTEWITRDLISADRLNKIEEAIYVVNERVVSNPSSVYIVTSMSENQIVGTGESFEITYRFASPNVGKGTLKVSVNGVQKVSQSINQGAGSVTLSEDLFVRGENIVRVTATDRVGTVSNELIFVVMYGSTELVPDFNAYTAYDYGSTVRYYFTPSAIDTSLLLMFYMVIDGVVQTPVNCVPDTRGYYTFPNNLSVGAHICQAYIVDETNKRSNTHEFNLIVIDEQSIVIASDARDHSVEEGEQVVLDYKVYMRGKNTFLLNIYVDDELVSEGSCGVDVNYYRSSSLSIGVHEIKIEAFDENKTVSDSITWTITIVESSFETVEATNAGALFLATALDHSNSALDRDKWIGRDQEGNEVEVQLENFTYTGEDGWVDNELIFNGIAKATVPIKPLANNAKYGFTLDIEFTTKPIGVDDALVLDLWDYDKDCGVKITTDQLRIRSSKGNEANLYFEEDVNVSAMFVVDRNEKKAKIYLNGVMCAAFNLLDYESEGETFLEDFSVDSFVELGGSGYCKIRNLRIYEVALTSNEIINNFISNAATKREQQDLLEFQKGLHLPTLTVYCDFSGLGKDDKKPCKIVYTSTDEEKYGKSFTLDHKKSSIQYQGTSSMAYPIKNYRLNLRDENGDKLYYDFPYGKPECRFTLKADFMASGHWQNTGLTKWINNNLYNYDEDNEKSMNPKKWFDLQNGGSIDDTRECIYGFPCRLILVNDGETTLNVGQYEPTPGNTKDMGIFNFNHDKDATDTMGFDKENFPNCMGFEVTANSDTSAGAFMSYKGDDPDEELEYYKQSFELRFPDEDDVEPWYGFLGIPDENGEIDSSYGIKRLIEWVDNCSDEEFVRDFDQYFNRDYTLRYYLLVITLGMVDNLGKNMMLDTWDGRIFMPRFYDCDTICSYDNTGDITFDVDIEMEQGYWNTSTSRLWTRIRDLMHTELVAKYNNMRQNGMSYESFMRCFYDEQIARIPQKYYNMDYDVKYAPFGDSYMGMAHGDGYQHLKRWLKKRILFVDTLFDYAPSYNNDILTIRANTTEEMTIYIETYDPVYQHMSWFNGQMDKKKIDGKIAVTFSGRAMAATDQEVLIYGGSNIKKISGISSMNPGEMLIGSATRLVELDASNCPILANINQNKANLTPHKHLLKLNLSNCPMLDGDLRINASPLIQEIDISNTPISGINFPPKMYNLTRLKLENCTALTTLDLSGWVSTNVTDMSNMFRGCTGLSIIKGIKDLDISNVTNMSYMFNACSNLTSLDLSGWNVSSVTNMNNTFYGCTNLTSLDVSGWNVSKVTNMSYMFYQCKNLTSLDLSGWDTSSVNGMTSMFQNCKNLTSLDLSGWDTSSVTGMAFMFQSCSNLTSLDVSGWDVSSVTKMNAMFDWCTNLTSLDLSGWDTPSVTSMDSMFYGCKNLISLNLSDWDTSKVTNTQNMFYACINLTSLVLSGWDTSSVTNMGAMFYQCENLTTLNLSNWTVPNMSNITGMTDLFAPLTSLSYLDLTGWTVSSISGLGAMLKNVPNITDFDLSDWDTSSVTSMTNMFRECSNLTSLDVSGWDVSSVTNMYTMFQACSNLTSLDLSGWDTSKVTSMSGMFTRCSKLTSLDVSGWDVSKVTDMVYMFYDCKNLTSLTITNWTVSDTTPLSDMFSSATNVTTLNLSNWDVSSITSISDIITILKNMTTLTDLNLSGWDTSSVTSMSSMFRDCTKLTSLDVSGWNTSKVTSMSGMFRNCDNLTSLDLSGWDTSSVTSMSFMFRDCTKLTSLDVSGWNTSKVTSMTYMFLNCENLTSLDVSDWNTSKVTSMTYMFRNCKNLTSLDLSGWNVSSVTSMSYMFEQSIGLTSLNLSGWDASKVTNTTNMFVGCKGITSLDLSNWTLDKLDIMSGVFDGLTSLTDLNLSGWEVSSIAGMGNMLKNIPGPLNLDLSDWKATTTMVNMSNVFQNYTNIVTLNLSGWDVSKVTNMYSMFMDTKTLTSLNVTGWDVSNVTNMNNMFQSCIKLSTIIGIENWEPSKVSTMVYMFNSCSNLKSLDLSGWDVSSVTNMSLMFISCSNLTSLDLSGWDTSGVTSMTNMFSNCSNLKSLDGIEDWNTSSVTSMGSMFYNCINLTSLDLSGWDTSSVTSMGSMFQYCSNLTSLIGIKDWDTSSVTGMANMFNGCSNLTSLDVTDWNTSSVTGMSSMFYQCTNLTSLTGIKDWDVSKVTAMNSMFSMCTKLTSLDGIEDWNTSSVTNMDSMFRNCQNLTSLDLSGWDVSKVTNMQYMFASSSNLTSLDLSGWNVSKVTNMQYMFASSSNLKSLDLSGWNTSSVTDMISMFYNCQSLTSLDLSGLDIYHVSNLVNIFFQCYKLETLNSMKNINANISFTHTMLDSESLYDAITNLAITTTNKTLQVGSTLMQKLTEVQIAEATNKGWTVA